MNAIRDLMDKARTYIQLTHVSDIARRYFFKNGIDGSMTALGVILGAWTLKVNNPNIIIGTGFGAVLAMGISGLFGAYITERAERSRRLKMLEDSLLTKLDESIFKDASEFVSVFAALIDGLSPALTASISLGPFLITAIGALVIWDAYIISVILNFATMFALGMYLGRVARGNIWLYGLQMLAAGVTISIIIFLLGGFNV